MWAVSPTTPRQRHQRAGDMPACGHCQGRAGDVVERHKWPLPFFQKASAAKELQPGSNGLAGSARAGSTEALSDGLWAKSNKSSSVSACASRAVRCVRVRPEETALNEP